MDWDRLKDSVFETINEYLIIEEQNKELIQILIEIDMMDEEEAEALVEAISRLKRSLDNYKDQLLKQLNSKDRICHGYKLLNVLMDFYDIDERIFEILENKLQFPMDDKQKKLLQYFTCDVGIRILFNTKARYQLNSYIFNTLSKGQGC
ncbi:hypothetical protein [Alkaliphilus serpentinus]|uniref:Uncharacterized protein n=1 Tax=Alkaliphilus serpentinus TaxID=1482731 RepID=A0A833HP47_9FIRM|nr:hypothetical protein [Alkaliphilus serpentinus]KAB3530275.1 hypothetical protein F8153_07610 [Alkaliphilus serpentinus]